MKSLFAALLALITFALPAGAQDAFPISQAVLTAGTDVRNWPITTTLSHLDVTATGFRASFDKKDRWPDVVPPGWDGPIQYTMWVGANVNGAWHLAAVLNVWRGLDVAGGPVTIAEQYSKNLYYLDRALAQHTPAVDEQLAFMVTAGALRGVSGVSVHERSNIVLFTFRGVEGGFDYNGVAPPVVPSTPVVDLIPRVKALEGVVGSLQVQVLTLAQSLEELRASITQPSVTALENRVKVLESKPIPAVCSASLNFGATRIPVSCRLQ